MGSKLKRDAFIFYRSYWDALRGLPDDSCGRLYNAIGAYALDGTEPKFKEGIELVVWKLIKPTLERSRKKSEGGRKGGGNPNLRKTSQTKADDDSKSVSNIVSNIVSNSSQTKADDVSNIVSNDKGLRIKDKGLRNNKESISSSLRSDLNSLEEEPSSPKGSEGLSESKVSDSENPSEKKEVFDFVGFAKFFNSEMDKAKATIPRIRRIEGQRKRFILARLRKYSEEDLRLAVTKAASSDFMNGNSDRGWIANFDWIFSKSNFPKVLEGNYDNHGTTHIANSGRSPAEDRQARIDAAIIADAETAILRVVQGVESPKPDI